MKHTYYDTKEEAMEHRKKGERVFFEPYKEKYYIVSYYRRKDEWWDAP